MSHQTFDIIFRGDIALGYQLADVKLRLEQLFKVDAARVDALFSGRPIPLKRGLDEASAQKYRDILGQAGAQVEIVANAAPASPTHQQPAPTQPRVRPVAWSLAPVGANLQEHSESRSITPIDISGLSICPQEGHILAASERSSTPVAQVLIPDLEVAKVGEDLRGDQVKAGAVIAPVKLQDWGLAALGSDLIRANEKPSEILPVIAVPDVGLAPAGADLGQLRPKVVAVEPDTSALKLIGNP